MNACNKCKVEKVATDFRQRRGKPITICRKCERQAQREYYWKSPEKYRAKSANSMRKARSDPRKHEQILKKQRAYYHQRGKHRDKVYFEDMKVQEPWKWRARNLRRNISKEISELWLRERFDKQGGVCALSGRLMKVMTFHVDHILPKKVGGTDALENLRLVCPEANMAKSGLTDAELFSLCEDILATQIPEIIGRAILEARAAA